MEAVGYDLVSLQVVVIEDLKGIRCAVWSNYGVPSVVPELLCSVIRVQWHNCVFGSQCA